MPDDTFLLGLHAAATWALCGLIWVVQLVVYPAFRLVPRAGFPSYHAAHVRRIAWVVGPLMAVEGLTAGWLVWAGHPGVSDGLAIAGLTLVLAHLATTAFVQVPLHARLEAGRDEAVVERLVRSNWIRTALWTARGSLVLLMP